MRNAEARIALHAHWSECTRKALTRTEAFGANTMTFSGVSQEQAEVDYLNGVREVLLGEALTGGTLQ
jgi:hypothetical protein